MRMFPLLACLPLFVSSSTAQVSPLLGPPRPLSPGPARALAIGDVDGDGIADLVLAAAPGLRALAGPGFSEPVLTVALPESADAVAIGDFDADGHVDLLASAFGVAHLTLV